MATARRMSRASGMGVGIPLADLLCTVPGSEEASAKDRLEKMVNLVVNSTIRLSVILVTFLPYVDFRQVDAGVEEESGGLEEAVKEVVKFYLFLQSCFS